jgi:hypothetical protein
MSFRSVQLAISVVCAIPLLVSCGSSAGTKPDAASGGSGGAGATGKGGSGGGGATASGAAGSPLDDAATHMDAGEESGVCSGASSTPPDASYPANSDGDLCRNAATMDCLNALAGTWSCNTNSAQFVVGRSGYTRLMNAVGQVGAGCMDCSGKWTLLADDQSWANANGTFVVTGSSATMTWEYCVGATVQACMQGGGTPGTTTCTRVSCVGP